MPSVNPEMRRRMSLSVKPASLAKPINSRKLFTAVTSRKELARGYSFQLDRARVSVADVKNWTALEARCCPFIEFSLDEGHAPGPIVLRLSGKPAVKKFIAAELVPPAS